MTVDEYLTKLGEVFVQKLCENIKQRLPLLDKLLEKETEKLLDSLKGVRPRSDERQVAYSAWNMHLSAHQVEDEQEGIYGASDDGAKRVTRPLSESDGANQNV
jgi:hypothetical protein